MNNEDLIMDPAKVITDLFYDKLNLHILVETREYPEETIFIVRVPHPEMNRAVELGNFIDQLLVKSNINGFVTIRADLESDQLTDLIGEVAENKARDWLGLGRITAHRPERDKRGWDFLLEYDLTSKSGTLLERVEPIMTCKLQVKGTTNDAGWVDIKLSNWDKMVKQPLPFFVLIIVFDKSDLEIVVASYLIHIGESYISQVLRRLRELSDSERSKLHEKTLRITWSDNDRLNAEHYGKSIGGRIREIVGPSAESYILKKIGWLKRAGYDNESMKGHIVFDYPDKDIQKFYSQLADLATGILKELPVSSIAMDEVRFGIPKPIKMLPVVDVSSVEKISISIEPIPSVGETTVTLSDRHRESLVSVTCQTYRASAIFRFLPANKEKIRLVSPFITFVFEPPTEQDLEHAKIQFSIQIPTTEKMGLETYLKSAKALKLLQSERNDGLWLDIGFKSQVAVLEPAPTHPMSAFIGPYNFPLPDDTDQVLSMAEHVGYLFREFQLDSHLEVRLNTLLKQSGQLMALYVMLKPGIMKPTDLGVSYSNKTKQSCDGKKTACIVSAMALIGNQLLVGVGVVAGTSEIIAEESSESIEVLRISNPSYQFIRKVQKVMHEGESYSIDPLIDECMSSLLGQDYDVVLNSADGQMARHASPTISPSLM